MDKLEIGKHREIQCIWIYGAPGTGKSRYVRDKESNLYSKPQNKWWDGYQGEEAVLLDDFDQQGECLSHYLKIWMDCYSFYGEYKGGTVPCVYKRFYITSNYTPSQIWKDPVLVQAIERRLELVSITQLEVCGCGSAGGI